MLRHHWKSKIFSLNAFVPAQIYTKLMEKDNTEVIPILFSSLIYTLRTCVCLS